MTETDKQTLSTEEIMQKIKNEVKKYKQSTFNMHRETISNINKIDLIHDLTPPFHVKEVYELADFNRYNDEKFIKNAFIGILGRHPDTAGAEHYLKMLRSGERSKTEIVVSLRFSSEGKQKNVTILGIKKRFLLTSLYRIPMIGYLVKSMITVLTLPRLLKRINQYENHFAVQNNIAFSNDLLLQNAINQKVNRDELEQKANRDELYRYLDSVNYAKEYMKISQNNMQYLIDEVKKRLPDEVLNQKELLAITEEEKHKFDSFYVEFEDYFRGTRKDIKQRVEVYLPYIENLPFEREDIKVLDVGCGRGEWIELLGDNGYSAHGIDLNRIMVAKSQELGLNVQEADVIEHLQSLENESLAVITGFHIIEHLPFEILMKMYDESLRVLKPGGIVIFETPNPENLIVGACNFYTDPTHINPLVPKTMDFILKQKGFSNVEVKRLHKYSDYYPTEKDDDFKNNHFYNEMDYAIIGYKK
jgi:O-antigen chain-terminating methyltransferase